MEEPKLYDMLRKAMDVKPEVYGKGGIVERSYPVSCIVDMHHQITTYWKQVLLEEVKKAQVPLNNEQKKEYLALLCLKYNMPLQNE